MPSTPEIRLEADDLDTLVLSPTPARIWRGKDITSPDIRVDADDTPDADGTDDQTEFHGAATLTISLWQDRMTWTERQAIKAFLHPSRRPRFIIRESADAPEIEYTLRASQWATPLSQREILHNLHDLTAQWVIPTGVGRATTVRTATAYATGDIGTEGVVFPLVFPLAWPASAIGGSVTVSHPGTATAYPISRLYGPADDPVWENLTTGQRLVFADLTIAAGDFLELDHRARTIRMNGDPDDSRYDQLVFPDSSWWTLAGMSDQILRYAPADFDVPAQAVIEWRDTYLP